MLSNVVARYGRAGEASEIKAMRKLLHNQCAVEASGLEEQRLRGHRRYCHDPLHDDHRARPEILLVLQERR